MSTLHRVELNFVPEEYWDLFVTALERHKSQLFKKLFNQSGILLILVALILGLLAQGIQYLLFEGGLEIIMLLLVFGSGYLIYEISQILGELQGIDIPQIKLDTLDFIERNKDIESAFLSYNDQDFLLEIDNDTFQHHWKKLAVVRKYDQFIYLEWEEINYIFGQNSMDEVEYEDFHDFLESKFDFTE